jgi:hypothetical protein
MSARVRTRMRSLASLLILPGALAFAACGPGRVVRFEGHPAADCLVEIPPRSGNLTLVGRTAQDPELEITTYALDYELPEALVNAVVEVEVRWDDGSSRYRVYTDRDVTVRYPPEGRSTAAGDGVQSIPAGAGAGRAAAATGGRPAAPTAGARTARPEPRPGARDDLPDDVPSATISEE